MSTQFIDLVFDGDPTENNSKLLEIQDPNGWKVEIGEWIRQSDGTRTLRLTPEDVYQALYVMPRAKGWYLDKDGEPIFVDGDLYRRPGQHAYSDYHFRQYAPFRRLILESTTYTRNEE